MWASRIEGAKKARTSYMDSCLVCIVLRVIGRVTETEAEFSTGVYRVTSFKKREKRGLKRNSGFPGCFRPHTHTKPIPTKGPVFSVDFGVDRGPRVVVGAAELLDRAPRTVYRASSRWASTWTAASRTSQWAFNHTPQGASPAGSPGGSPSAGSPGQLDLLMNVLL